MDDSLLNLEEVSHLVAIKKGWSEEQRQQTLNEYHKYMAAAATKDDVRNELLRPSRQVDDLWHEHILNTRLYVDYCMDNFGFYIHHISCIPKDYKNQLSIRIDRQIPDTNLGELDSIPMADCGTDKPEPGLYSPQLADCGAPSPVPDPIAV